MAVRSTMLEFTRTFTKAQRTLLAEKVSDGANVALGAMVFGQFLGDQPFSALLAFVGFVLWASMTFGH